MTEPNDPQPQPVINAGGWAGLAMAIVGTTLTILVAAHVITPADQQNLITAFAPLITAVAGIVSVIIAALHTRKRVTPLARPRDAKGRRLVPVDEHGHGRHALKPRPDDDHTDDTQEIPRVSRRLGRKPPTNAPRIRLDRRLLHATVPMTIAGPPAVDWYSKVPSNTWGMDGNDSVGDCTLAEVDHSTKARQVAAGNTEVRSTVDEVLGAYSAITGYDPSKTRPDGTNPTDQGAVMQDVRDYWRKNGIKLGGKLDKLTLFAEVDHTDLNLIRWCVARFGAVALGINFPESAMEQFDAGEPWDVVKGSPIEGGHAISMVGYDARYAYVITWGKVQPMTWDFFEKYVEEAWTDISADWLNAQSGQDPLGEVAYALGEQFAQVTGKPNPFPAPTPEPPAPTPGPAPAPAPEIPADWVAWAKHVLTLKEQTRATVKVATEIIAAARG